MKLPRPERAVIDPAKLRDYLLSSSHPVGRFKAAFFTSLGYRREERQRLEEDLHRQVLEGEAIPRQETEYGQKYEIRSMIMGPNGRSAEVVSVWIVLADEDFPRLITAYPGGGR